MLREDERISAPSLPADPVELAQERLEELRSSVAELGSGGDHAQRLERVAVLATELREASDALGYERLLALAADVEDVAGKLRAGKVQPAKPVRDAMAEAAGVMRSLLLAYRDGHLRRRPDTPAHPDRTNTAQAGAETQPPADADQPRPEPAAEPAPETAAGEVATPAVPAVEGGDTELGIPRAPEAAPEPAPDLPAPGTELAQAEPSAAVVDSPVPAETSAATVGSAPGSETELIAPPSAPESAAVPSQPDPQPQGAGTFEAVAAALSVVEEAATPPAAPVGKATNPPAPATAEDAVAPATPAAVTDHVAALPAEVPAALAANPEVPAVAEAQAVESPEPAPAPVAAAQDTAALPPRQLEVVVPTETSHDAALAVAPAAEPTPVVATSAAEAPAAAADPLDALLASAPPVEPKLETPWTAAEAPAAPADPLDALLASAPPVEPKLETPWTAAEAPAAPADPLDALLASAPPVEPKLETPWTAAEAPPAPAADTPEKLNIDDPGILADFVVESGELIQRLEDELGELEARPEDAELLNSIFRAAHTVKGTSAFIGFTQMTELTHKLESVLDRMRSGKLRADRAIIEGLLAGASAMRTLLERFKAGNRARLDLSRVLATLVHILDPSAPPPPPPGAGPVAETATRTNAPETLRVDVTKLDALNDLVGELVLGRNRLATLLDLTALKLRDEALRAELDDGLRQISRVAGELQVAAMRTRMVPAATVLARFPRMVRELAREKGKQVELVLEGTATELDKAIAEKLPDALVHMIRNSVDHAIQPPAERQGAGKPAAGRITIAVRPDGAQVQVVVADDGRGIDPVRMRNKAAEKGLITQAQAAALSDEEAIELIFLPGFSTAEQLSSTSGRGVGMDVVRAAVEGLGGDIGIQSVVGRGTTFRLQLPLRLAITEALEVDSGGETWLVPVSGVEDIVMLRRGQVVAADGRHVVRLRERVVRVAPLGRLLDLGNDSEYEFAPYLLVLAGGDRRGGVLVQRLLGRREIVLRPVPGGLPPAPGVAGCAVMGDGRVRLVLHPAEVVRLLTQSDVMKQGARP